MPTKVNYKKIGYITKKGLLERGWTDVSINDFLGEPDDFFYHSGRSHPTYRYRYDRVILTEESEVFKDMDEEKQKQSRLLVI